MYTQWTTLILISVVNDNKAMIGIDITGFDINDRISINISMAAIMTLVEILALSCAFEALFQSKH